MLPRANTDRCAAAMLHRRSRRFWRKTIPGDLPLTLSGTGGPGPYPARLSVAIPVRAGGRARPCGTEGTRQLADGIQAAHPRKFQPHVVAHRTSPGDAVHSRMVPMGDPPGADWMRFNISDQGAALVIADQ